MILLSIALACARSRTVDGEGGRDGAVASDGSTIDPSRDGGRETRDGAPIDPDPTGDAGRTRDGGRPRDAGAPPSPEALGLARLECVREAACDPYIYEVAFLEGVEGCVAARAETLEPILARGHAAPTSQWCVTTRAADADCDGYRDDDGRSVEGCVEPAGRLRSGDPCLDDVECGRSATDGEMRCLDCQCRPLLREGDRCDPGTCASDLQCMLVDGATVCVRPAVLPAGAACSDEDPSRWCAHGNSCVDGVCVRRPRYGEVCVPDGVSCFDLYYHVGICERADDGAHRCRRFEPDRPVVPAGTRCTRADVCAGGASCPIGGVCPSDCTDTDGERVCVYGTCNEATGECGFPQECVDG
jgi:hypothetical protein